MELNNAFDPGAGVQQYSRSDGAGFFYVIYANILDPYSDESFFLQDALPSRSGPLSIIL